MFNKFSNQYLFSIPLLFFTLIAFTISFDIFLVVNLGFNFRISQLFVLILILIAFGKVFYKRRIIWPLCFSFLLLWAFFIFSFIPHTDFLTNSLGYMIWLVFNIMMVFSIVQLFSTLPNILSILKIYIVSFAFVASFGLYQFFAPFLRLNSPLVMQWWMEGRLARINGFSYEPSYFSTYLIMGWIMTSYLLEKRSILISRRTLIVIYVLETGALLLSGSRMGWIVMGLWYFRYLIIFLMRLKEGYINLFYGRKILSLVITLLILLVVVFTIVGVDEVTFLLAGLDVAGGSSHSSDERLMGAGGLLQLFLSSPVVGYSLGGISSALGNLNGVIVDSVELAKDNQGVNVFLEVLVASGIVGFIPFLIYFGGLICFPVKLASKRFKTQNLLILKALVWSFIFECIILQFNQNILRPYVWLHIAILSAFYSALKQTIQTSDNYIFQKKNFSSYLSEVRVKN